jgi:hypothetical protein
MGFTLDKSGFESIQGWGKDIDTIGKAWEEGKWEVCEWIETEYYSYIERHVAIHVFHVKSTDHCSRLIKHKLKATSVSVLLVEYWTILRSRSFIHRPSFLEDLHYH